MRKRIFLTIAVMAMVSFPAVAQSDGFFSEWEKNEIREGSDNGFDMPGLPESHGFNDDQSGEAPLGTGLLILTALGAGYAVAKRKEER